MSRRLVRTAVPHAVLDLAAAQADVLEHLIVHRRKLPHVAADAQLIRDRRDQHDRRQTGVEDRRLALPRSVGVLCYLTRRPPQRAAYLSPVALYGPRPARGAWRATSSVLQREGSLDEPLDLRSAVHIRTARRLPDVVIPETTRQFPGKPD
jgi:hypothetical protein